jgi:hypothetical protein
LPDGAVRLWFDLSGAATEPVVLGPRLDAAIVTLQGSMAGISLAIHPAAARDLLGAPVADVRAQAVSLSNLWGTTRPQVRVALSEHSGKSCGCALIARAGARMAEHRRQGWSPRWRGAKARVCLD